MSVVAGYKCDKCEYVNTDNKYTDDGPPENWWQIMQMKTQGSWESNDEKHFCSNSCLATFFSGQRW